MCPPTHQKEPEMTEDGFEVAFQTSPTPPYPLPSDFAAEKRRIGGPE